jgi:hypothetical protein
MERYEVSDCQNLIFFNNITIVMNLNFFESMMTMHMGILKPNNQRGEKHNRPLAAIATD